MSQQDDSSDFALEQTLEVHRQRRSDLPCAWNPFFARFGRLRPIQLAAIPPILMGRDVLVTAPTAGGKTEAVVAPACERLIRERWSGLACVLVTPTRALVNDLFERLNRPVESMGLVLGRKTSDHQLPDNLTAQFLITTPESLESLLTFRSSQLLAVRALILDEIHLLDGTARGDQLRTMIQRLRLFLAFARPTDPPLQVVAMSATLPNSRRTADRYLGPHAEVISVAGQRAIESAIVVAHGDDEAQIQTVVQATEQFADVHKMLVFCNSRKQVDACGHHFQTGRFQAATVHCHHGSLSKAAREQAEQRFKVDQFSICVATMTLEIGIDIGDVDLVVCMSPPTGMASFLQRIGRGCRRLQGATRVLCVAHSRAQELIFESLIEAASHPLPEGPRIPFRRSVAIQQVLAYLRQVARHRRTLLQLERALTHETFPSFSIAVLTKVLRDMHDCDLITVRNGVYEPASQGWEFIQSSRIYSNINTPAGLSIVDVDTGRPVSTATGLQPDSSKHVRIAGRAFEVIDTRGNKVRVRTADSSEKPPDYGGRPFPYAYDIGVALAMRFGCNPSRLLAIEVNDVVFLMTWLGKFLNSLLASVAQKQRLEIQATSFSLACRRTQVSQLLEILQRLVKQAVMPEELDELDLDRLVELGAHHGLLSSLAQRDSCRDWSDSDFLRRWSDAVTEIELLNTSDSRAADLLAIAKVP